MIAKETTLHHRPNDKDTLKFVYAVTKCFWSNLKSNNDRNIMTIKLKVNKCLSKNYLS